MLITSILGIFIGIVLGLTGAGGGILAVPALVFGMGWTVQQASPVALIAVICGALAGLIDGFRKKLVCVKEAVLIAIAAIPFSMLGVYLARIAPNTLLKLLFSVVIFYVGVRSIVNILRRSKQTNNQTDNSQNNYPTANTVKQPNFETKKRTEDSTGQNRHSAGFKLLNDKMLCTPSACLSIGAVAGLLSGLLGVGGGFVIVPLLRKFSRISMHRIVATSLMIIFLISINSVLGALLYGARPPLKETGVFALAVVIGVVIGRKLISTFNEHTVQLIFALLLIMVSSAMLFSLL